MKKKLLIAAVLLALWVIHPIAYVTYGVKWPTNVVHYVLNPTNSVGLGSSAVATEAQNADAIWSNQTTANITLTYDGVGSGNTMANDGTNNVFFRHDAVGFYAAETYASFTGSPPNGTLVDFDMVVHTASKYVFFTGRTGCVIGDATHFGIYLDNLQVHEFGHALGLGHSGVKAATMTSQIPGQCDLSQLILDPDDIAGIQFLYPPTGTVTPPTAPSSLTATRSVSLPESAIDLAWTDNASTENGFAVLRSTDNSVFTEVTQLAANTVTYTNTGLAPGTTYYYKVRAYNGGGNSNNSNTASASTSGTPQTLPSTPSNPSPANKAINVSRNADLSWTSTGATSYSIDFGTSTTPPNVGTSTTPSWVLPTLAANTKYYWKITATNAAGSRAGSIWFFTTGAN
jgi:matrixin/fibronectin type III domain protein